MYEAVFRIAGSGAYAAPTRRTDATIELWCNDHCDMLHVRGGTDAVREHVEGSVGVRERVERGKELVLVTDECLKTREDDTVERYLARHDCLLVPPLRYARGAKFCRVLALDAGSLTAVYRDLTGEYAVDVESKREVGSVTPDAPLLTADALPALSPRQREVFTMAHERGYYEIPRETTTEELAAALGVERRTAEEHLRRAENKLADALVEYL